MTAQPGDLIKLQPNAPVIYWVLDIINGELFVKCWSHLCRNRRKFVMADPTRPARSLHDAQNVVVVQRPN